MVAMKNKGVPFEERIAKLEELEYPKPCRDFIYNTFNAFSEAHPWIGQENIRPPKSIAREMLRKLPHLQRLHRRTAPRRRRAAAPSLRRTQGAGADRAENFKTEPVQEMEAWIAGVLPGTDSSLLDEWERMRDPNFKPDEQEGKAGRTPTSRNKQENSPPSSPPDLPLSASSLRGKLAAAVSTVSSTLNAESLGALMEPYYAEHERIRIDNEKPQWPPHLRGTE